MKLGAFAQRRRPVRELPAPPRQQTHDRDQQRNEADRLVPVVMDVLAKPEHRVPLVHLQHDVGSRELEREQATTSQCNALVSAPSPSPSGPADYHHLGIGGLGSGAVSHV